MKISTRILALAAAATTAMGAMAAVTVPAPTGSGVLPLGDMDLSKVTCFDDNGKTKANANKSTLGNQIIMKDTIWASGMGTHAPSVACFRLNGATRFQASAGIDDEADQKANHGIVDMTITLYKGTAGTEYVATTLTRDDAATFKLNIPLDGYDYMKIDFAQGAQPWADHVDLGGAFFNYAGTAPVVISESEITDGGSTPTTPSDGIVRLPSEGDNGAIIIPLSSLDTQYMKAGWGTTKVDKSMDNNTLTLGGVKYASGIGSHATSRIVVKLNGSVTKFHTVCGIDDEVSQNGNVNWTITLVGEGGSQEVAASGNATRNPSNPATVDVDCVGWKYIILDADANGADSYDHFDWANAYFEYIEQNSNPPAAVDPAILEGSLQVATTWFAQPGVKMMQHAIPVDPNAEITVEGLPAGLSWDARRSAIVGTIDTEGEYQYTLSCLNAVGEPMTTTVTLTVSKNLPLATPFMGWLSWNVVEDRISEDVVKTVTDAMISSGLYDAGYNFVMMDDKWHAGARNADGTPQANSDRFPNGVKAAADYVHDHGMHFGIYSDAGSHTCGGMFGSYGSEETDAKAYAEWGVDIVKYDYCNVGSATSRADAEARYKAMGEALKNSGRDIIFYICEWGVREPWLWGPEALGQTWRVSYDVRDCWTARSPGVGVTQSIDVMNPLWMYSGPNRFNDADMLCTAIHGTGKSSSDLCVGKPGMTQDEYQTQFSLWCMWASPMALSFDLTKPIDDDDLRILTNTEAIALNQDRLGMQARYLGDTNGMKLYAKDLENGDVAIAVVNTNATAGTYTLDFDAVPSLEPGMSYHFRDIWAKEDLGVKSGSFDFEIPTHATRVFRLVDEKTFGSTETISADMATADMAVESAEGTVTVKAGASGLSKRVIISDLAGRVLAQSTTSAASIELPVNAPRGTIVVVNLVSGGRAQSVKVTL